MITHSFAGNRILLNPGAARDPYMLTDSFTAVRPRHYITSFLLRFSQCIAFYRGVVLEECCLVSSLKIIFAYDVF